jgi:hypothetical protein
MSFDLVVVPSRLPNDLKGLWEQAIAGHGLRVEICPNFDPATWVGGFLPFQLHSGPLALLGTDLREPVLAGCEVYFSEGEVVLSTGSGRSSADFVVQCIAAATLTVLTEGMYEDPQAGTKHDSRSATDAALAEIHAFIHRRLAEQAELIQRPFPGWHILQR